MKKRILTGIFLLSITGIVQATPITLDFEGIGSQASILEFYNGGTDSVGNSGTDYGVSFGSNTLALKESDPQANFSGEPSAETAMFFLTGSAVLDFAQGFDTGFSFYYSTTTFAGTVNVYDGLAATGNLLGSISINALGVGPDVLNPFSNWVIGSLGFTGIAKSIDFGGTVNQVGYDNVTFGSVNPNLPSRPVPSPGSLALLCLGLAGLGYSRKKVS
ncbi:MAG: PEP-CTERM sorting domain-containing protein [Halioglobus sp.]